MKKKRICCIESSSKAFSHIEEIASCDPKDKDWAAETGNADGSSCTRTSLHFQTYDWFLQIKFSVWLCKYLKYEKSCYFHTHSIVMTRTRLSAGTWQGAWVQIVQLHLTLKRRIIWNDVGEAIATLCIRSYFTVLLAEITWRSLFYCLKLPLSQIANVADLSFSSLSLLHVK